jgi:FkbM family methyltransferase
MAANSLPRRVLKRALAPLLPEPAYRIVQAVAMGWDIRSGSLSEPELDLISYGVRPGETVIDIGANYGLYSYHFSRAVRPGGKVYAFEPVPFTAKTFKLIATALRFNNVTLFEKGCGDKPGTLRFRVPIAESGAIMAGVVHIATRDNERDGRQQHARFERSKEIECEIVTLDDVIPSSEREVSFIKCDIEGADYFALKGAAKIIEKHKPTVVSEINPWFVEGFGLTVQQLVSFFTDQGYKLYRYENKQLIETPVEKVVEDNWVFVHPSRMDRFRSILAPSA